MPVQRKLFRIEEMTNGACGTLAEVPSPPSAPVEPQPNWGELISELRALRTFIEERMTQTAQIMEAQQAQSLAGERLKTELELILAKINDTKQEIATLHVTGFHGQEMSRVRHELDAVVEGTEQATQAILAAAEQIDQCAHALSQTLAHADGQALVRRIQECVIGIFEACNFQDLTGQRITKVVAAWKFIEAHIERMLEIWGGLDALKEFIPEAPPEREGDARLLNGPKLAGDAGHASQDDIDAMFN